METSFCYFKIVIYINEIKHAMYITQIELKSLIFSLNIFEENKMDNLYSLYFICFEKLSPLMPHQNDFVPGISDCYYNVLYIRVSNLWH